MKAADITDEAFLDAVRTVKRLRPRPKPSRWDVGYVLGGQADHVAAVGRYDISPSVDRPPMPDPVIPEKIVLAKARRLIRRGLIDGCGCGCRGDFEFPGHGGSTDRSNIGTAPSHGTGERRPVPGVEAGTGPFP